ncbi:MAG TPA: YiiD C-terminal domain-containing protein [Acidiferrobacterales bacterium]|nr:YiiD C-terminal domain-containing protein [Acidiferrobacterales bacterium]
MQPLANEALRELERTLHAEIPLTRAMCVRVAHFDATGLTLRAPLEPNINHKCTAFGGSLATLATLAGWGLLQLLLREQQPVTVVIQESSVQYLRPVAEDMQATCSMPQAGELEKFLRSLARKGMARIELEVLIPAGGETAVKFRGRFVALDKHRHPHAQPG